jgi:superfamily II DNA helicase RecQ
MQNPERLVHFVLQSPPIGSHQSHLGHVHQNFARLFIDCGSLRSIFRERFGHEWQLDVAEAILLGLDSVVIAGTGAGKTMPFMMPLLLDKNRVIIVSPLKVLQADQVRISLFPYF